MITALIVATVLATPAISDTSQMRTQERQRLDQFHASAGRAVLQAMSGGNLGDIDLLQEALSGSPLPALGTSLAGHWSCRTIKLGGSIPLIVYAPFKCEITPDGAAFNFVKSTGSQRGIGQITLKDGTIIYLGVGHVADADPMLYSDLPPEDFGNEIYQPQVGIVEQTSLNMVRIMFPAPVNEGLFDLLYLTRVNN